jgi:hypothetical protein
MAGALLRPMNIQTQYFWRFINKGSQENNDQTN